MKAYSSSNQSRMGMSKNMMILPEVKISERMNIPMTKTVTQVIFFSILSLFENDTLKNLMKC